MSDQPQSYANHGRFHPIFHFVLIPLLLINLIVSIIWLVHVSGLSSTWDLVLASMDVVLAVVFYILAFLVRSNPMKVQDRVIRLEEQLRLYALLPEPLRRRVPELTEDQLIGLRFAPDEELPALAERAWTEKLSRKDIKKAINNWRPDNWRV
ncbi:MAG: DUF6526 family protein [Silvibacterium sp.]|jgi:hypothetical protein